MQATGDLQGPGLVWLVSVLAKKLWTCTTCITNRCRTDKPFILPCRGGNKEEQEWKRQDKEEQFRAQQEILKRRRDNTWQKVIGAPAEGCGWLWARSAACAQQVLLHALVG